jgi:hypothetical protein
MILGGVKQMNRRNLLKNAGMMMLAAPALKAAAFDKCGLSVCTNGQPKNLIVRVVGPFGYQLAGPDMQNIRHIIVMAPQVGIRSATSPHVPWMATTSNECRFVGAPKDGPEYELVLPDYPPPTQFPNATGTTVWQYPPPTGPIEKGESPMFTIKLPVPNSIIGINPTCVCLSKASKPPVQCTNFQSLAAGTSFVYNAVNLDKVSVTAPPPIGGFKPCFANDESLPNATLEMNLTPVNINQANHTEAKAAFKKMVRMYPWIDEDTIDFSFDPCPSSTANFGSGADCKVCGVMVPPPPLPPTPKS